MKTIIKNSPNGRSTNPEDVSHEQVADASARTLRPSHPGSLLRRIIEEQGWSQGEFAARLGVSRLTVNEVLREKRPLSPDMAHRVGRLLNNGGGFWIRLQAQLDIWDALQMDTGIYQDIEPMKKLQANS